MLGGLDYNEDDIRRDNLDHYLSADPHVFGPFLKVLANDITIREVAPFVAVRGDLGPHVHFYGGLRHEQIEMNNTDMIKPSQSYDAWRGFENPKATVAWTPGTGPAHWLPSASFSIGQAFFTQDPRISAAEGSTPGAAALASPFERSHSEQLVLEKEVGRTDVRITFGRTTMTATLAKIDPDNGLAELGFLSGTGSGLLNMAIVGGAIIPVIQGVIADRVGLHHAFLLPVLCYMYIIFYGVRGSRPTANSW